jgi:hypothetical protein
VSTTDRRVAHSPLSRRARFDLATLITAGVASTAFFLFPVWTSLVRSTASDAADRPRLAVTRPALASQVAMASVLATTDPQPRVPTPRPRTPTHKARTAKATPEFVQAKADVKPAQSRLSRFFLGDGSERVQPFPLAERRAER